MSNEIAIPDYLKDMIDAGQVQDDGANLISAGSSVPRISLKGKKFRFIVDGEEVQQVNDQIHVVILGTQPEKGMSKTFYEGDYNPNDSGPPDCSSSNGVSPDSWVSNPQSSSCATCEKNKWGSATSKMTGKKAKACRDSKRLMVIHMEKGVPLEDATVYILNVTVSSLKALSDYGKMLMSNRVPMAAAITTVTMDDDSDFPKIDFTFAGIMKEENGKKALARAAEKEWDNFDMQHAALEDHSAASNNTPQLTQGEVITEPEPEKSAPASKPSDVDDILNQW